MARLADLDVLVLDCQSTGATPAQGALLEIGWTQTRASGAALYVVAPVAASIVSNRMALS